ncbi:uncharacterized protein LOC116168085 [Photinus pyralis]|nr:uncharacterized protein LOC116168085 [Photinus pyralis]
MMYKDFLAKHPAIDISYCLYRNVISSMNISFVKLGHEECWTCELYDVHKTKTGHTKEEPQENCDECKKFTLHQKKYREARRIYQEDEKKTNDSHLIVSADLQKVIMLPRLEMFKEVIFTPRIVAFNESFVPIGKKQQLGPTAVIWHEAISGRSAKDIISTFYAFLLSVRDVKHITLWLDNCSSQNKNWSLFCFFVFMVNLSEVELQTLQVKYFEAGHTFMAADSFHHQVEKSLKHMGKVYDFKDFSEAVRKASHKVKVIEMEIENFYDWEDATSQYKLGKIKPRPYVHDMVQVNFERGKKTLIYKTEFESPGIEINFINARCMKVEISKPKPKCNPKGITKDRKCLIVSKLVPIMPESRRNFWENLPTATDEQSHDSDEN